MRDNTWERQSSRSGILKNRMNGRRLCRTLKAAWGLLSVSWLIVVMTSPLAWSAELTSLGQVTFTGHIAHDKDVSAICTTGEFLVIAADEGALVQVLKREGEHYAVLRDVVLDTSGKELDIEGLACDGNSVYAVGSHSWKRDTIKADKSYTKNRAAIINIQPEPSRDQVFRFTVDTEGQASPIEKTSLRAMLDHDEIFHTFSHVPSKENGIDIEGIATRAQRLYVGFRGPVLRDNYVPVVSFPFTNPVAQSTLLFVTLDGRGIRDLAAVEGGFLVLAGPVGDGPGSYQVYFWDGQDCLPGTRDTGQVGQCTLLGEVPAVGEAKAEGITVVAEDDARYEVLIVFDGLKNGGATRFRLPKR